MYIETYICIWIYKLRIYGYIDMMIIKDKTKTQKRCAYLGRPINKAAIAALALVFAIVILPGVSLADETDPVIAFPDDALKNELLELSGADADGDGELTEGELAALTGRLDIMNSGIKDIAGMQYATGLSELNLSGNRIRDISCLAALVSSEPHNLAKLDVSQNYLDLTEGGGDITVINELINAGCAVTYEPQSAVAVEEVALDCTSLDIYPDGSAALHAEVYPEDAADKAVIWSSDNEAVATVADGEVTAVSIGTANITAASNDGGAAAVCAVRVNAVVLSSSKYTIADGYVTGVGKATVVDVFKSLFNNAYGDLRVFDAAGNAYNTGLMGTGMTVRLYIGGALRDEATVLVSGDANGDGIIDILDYTSTRFHILEFETLQGGFEKCADSNKDGIVDILDYTAIRFDILGFEPIGGALPDLPEVTDPKVRKFLDIALAQIGKPYVFGDEGPDSFDCSGFAYYCLNQAGHRVGRSTANTYSNKTQWQYVNRNELQPGDLMFYFSDDPSAPAGYIGHVGIYLGNGYHIHASSANHHVVICRLNNWYDEVFSHGRRVFN